MAKEIDLPDISKVIVPELPRPPKDLTVIELWGVDESVLHNEDELKSRTGLVIARMNLHPAGDCRAHEYYNQTTGARGYSLDQFLGESGIIIHTYFENEGHLDGVLATCSPEVDFTPLPAILHDVMQAQRGGFVFRANYPDMQHLQDTAKKTGFRVPFVVNQRIEVWPVAPFPKSE